MFKPARPNDIQIQKAGTVDDPAGLLREAVAEACQHGEHLDLAGYRYEITQDGAGVRNYTMYAIFNDTRADKILDPRNLNQSPQRVFGNTVDGPELAEKGIGTKETKF